MPCPEKFKQSLERFGVDGEVIARINQGYEALASKSPKRERAAYFKRAVDIMAECLAPEEMQKILEWNACCRSGKIERAARAFAQAHAGDSLEERLERIGEEYSDVLGAPLRSCLWVPVRNEDGTFTVTGGSIDGGRYACGCSQFSRLKLPYDVSRSYCFCCGGHFQYHYEIMLGMKLKVVEIISSPLDSGGRRPCAIRFAAAGE